MPDLPIKPDAIMVPFNYPPGIPQDRLPEAFRLEFGPVLQSKIVFSRPVPTHQVRLLTGTGDDHPLFHPDTHPLAKQHRHTWHDRGDGVKYGVLNVIQPGPTRTARQIAQYGQHVADNLETWRTDLAALKTKPQLAPEETAEMNRLQNLVDIFDSSLKPE